MKIFHFARNEIPCKHSLTCEINDSNNFNSTKQIDVKIIKLYMIATKGTIRTIITTAVNKATMLILTFAIIQIKEPIENVKNLQATYQDVFNISETLQSKDNNK